MHGIAFSPTGQLLATASADETVKVWEVPTLREVTSLRGAFSCLSVQFSPDGRTLVTGSEAASRSVYLSLLRAARDGRIAAADLDASYGRILALKRGL